MSPPFLLASPEVDILTLITRKRSLRPREAAHRAWGAQGIREPPRCSHWGPQGGGRLGGGAGLPSRKDGWGWGGETLPDGNESGLEKKEGGKKSRN